MKIRNFYVLLTFRLLKLFDGSDSVIDFVQLKAKVYYEMVYWILNLFS